MNVDELLTRLETRAPTVQDCAAAAAEIRRLRGAEARTVWAERQTLWHVEQRDAERRRAEAAERQLAAAREALRSLAANCDSEVFSHWPDLKAEVDAALANLSAPAPKQHKPEPEFDRPDHHGSE